MTLRLFTTEMKRKSPYQLFIDGIEVSSDTIATDTTYNGLPTKPIDSGTYNVVVTVTKPNYTGSDSGILVIDPAPLAITITNDTFTYDSTAQEPEFTTTPAGIDVDFRFFRRRSDECGELSVHS